MSNYRKTKGDKPRGSRQALCTCVICVMHAAGPEAQRMLSGMIEDFLAEVELIMGVNELTSLAWEVLAVP